MAVVKIKRALISVSDKTGIVDFAYVLQGLGIEILSTGGTAKLLSANHIKVIEVSDYTGFPEMLDGRVKTLHPKIHGGLLALRENPSHIQQLKEQAIGLIDMVVVNLYPFEQVIAQPGVKIEEVIENIDIGGPSMLRSAAKNSQAVAVVSSPTRYPQIAEVLKKNNGSLPEELMRELGIEVFTLTSHYDGIIHKYLSNYFLSHKQDPFPQRLDLSFIKVQDLRYGENPHQKAAFYRDIEGLKGFGGMKQVWGKEPSFNNILDLNAAVNILKEFESPAVVFIKHNNPCGVAQADDILKAYCDALNCDKLSAFGGIVGVNRKLDLALAKLIVHSGFLECVVCPGLTPEALNLLQEKKNLRILELPDLCAHQPGLDFKRVAGGILLQDDDAVTVDEKNLKVVTRKKPTPKELTSLIFTWKVVKHVKSNAIVLGRGTKTIGIGAGQMSRVDAVFIAIKKAGKLSAGSVLASDAFFPKEDAVRLAAKFKIKAIIQPGGSMADEEIILACDKYKIAMVTTGIRHFKH